MMIVSRSIITIATTISLLSAPLAYADCPNAVRLRVGDKVEDCERIGLSIEYDLKIRQDLKEKKIMEKEIKEQYKLIQIKDLTITSSDKRANLWYQESERVRNAYDKERNRTKWDLWAGILMGIGLTALGGWAAGQVSR